ncbi:MAG: hypothetical protein M5T52_24370 [Ignavibacteriaceae bacterium]|nr:hypothetical protein [Ignavibacteriaceae bacterium]
MRLTEAIIEILKDELNGKELKRNENQQKKVTEIAKLAGRIALELITVVILRRFRGK